jgi:ferredoxin
MAVYQIVFSPTGGTENCAYIVATTLNSNAETIDLTDRAVDFTKVVIAPEDICVIAVPSFGGRVPAVALERLAQIKGNGAKAILMAVYGNREIDDTLLELKEVAENAGFKTIAAISAVAEHSMVRQFAANRPDVQDQMELERFATQIAARIAVGMFKEVKVPGNKPYKEFNGVPAKPMASEACKQCGKCADQCPVGAIPKDAPNETNKEKCITCLRCVAICPAKARDMSPEFKEAITQRLAPLCAERKANTLYI